MNHNKTGKSYTARLARYIERRKHGISFDRKETFDKSFTRIEKAEKYQKESGKIEEEITRNKKLLAASNPTKVVNGEVPFHPANAFAYISLSNYFLQKKLNRRNKKTEIDRRDEEIGIRMYYAKEVNQGLQYANETLSAIEEYRKNSLAREIQTAFNKQDKAEEAASTFFHVQNFAKNVDNRKAINKHKIKKLENDISKAEDAIAREYKPQGTPTFLYNEFTVLRDALLDKKAKLEAEIVQIEEDRKRVKEHIKSILYLQHKALQELLKTSDNENKTLLTSIENNRKQLDKIDKNPGLTDTAHKDHEDLKKSKAELEEEMKTSEDRIAEIGKSNQTFAPLVELLDDFKKANSAGNDASKEAFALKYIAMLGQKNIGDLSNEESDILKEHTASRAAAGTVNTSVVDKIFSDGENLLASEISRSIRNAVGDKEGALSQMEKGVFIAQEVIQRCMEKQIECIGRKKLVSLEEAKEVSSFVAKTKHLQKQFKKFSKEKNPEKKTVCLMRLLAACYDTEYPKEDFFKTQEAKDAGLTLRNVIDNPENLLKFRITKAQILQKRAEAEANNNNIPYPYNTKEDLIFRNSNPPGQVHNFGINATSEPKPPLPPTFDPSNGRNFRQREEDRIRQREEDRRKNPSLTNPRTY